MQVGVANKDGEFVSGLKAEDFEILINEEARSASLAIEVDLRPAWSGAVSPSITTDTHPLPPAARRHYVFFFDFAFNSRRAIRESRSAAVAFVEDHLHDSDLVAVVGANRFGAEMTLPFTSDRSRVLDALQDISLAEATDLIVPDHGNLDYEWYAAMVQNYLAQLAELADALRAVEGRKHVVFFSTGFMDRTLAGGQLDELSSTVEARADDGIAGIVTPNTDPAYLSGSAEIRAGIAEVVEAFRVSDTVIHAVDGRSLPSRSRSADGRQALSYLANETGGTTHWNRNRVLPALQSIGLSSARYYLVGYTMRPGDAPGATISIKVRKPSVEVTSAPSVLAPVPSYREMTASQRQLQLAQALAHDAPMPGIGVRADLRLLPEHDDGGTTGMVLVEVPADELSLLHTARGDEGVEVELAGFAFGADGEMIDTFRRRVFPFPEVPGDSPRGLQWLERLRLDRRGGRIRIVAREAALGRLTALTLPYESASAAGAGAVISQPLVVRRADEWPGADRNGPFLVGGTKYRADLEPHIGSNEDFMLLFFAGGLSEAAARGSQATVWIQPQDHAAEEVASLRLETRGVLTDTFEGTTLILVRLRTPVLTRNGNAWLRFQAASANGGVSVDGALAILLRSP